MKQSTDEFAKLITKADRTDSEILCGHWLGVRNELLESMNLIKARLAIVEEKIKVNDCESLLDSGVIEFGSYNQAEYYDQGMQWKDKAIYVMHKAKKPLTSTEVTSAIFQLEFNPGESKKDSALRKRAIQQSISGILAQNTKDMVKTKAIFYRLPKVDPEDTKEQIRFWFADEAEPSES